MIDITITTYNQIRTQFLPIPSKSHYLFNIRDILKVFQGMLLTDITSITSKYSYVKLWAHEMNRVFVDRLVDESDRIEAEKIIKSNVQNFNVDTNEYSEPKPKEEVPVQHSD